MKNAIRILFCACAVVLFLFHFGTSSFAATPVSGSFQKALRQEYFVAKIVEVLGEEKTEVAGFKTRVQTLGVTIGSGYEKGKDVEVKFMTGTRGSEEKYSVGERVVLQKDTYEKGEVQYQIIDRFRIDSVVFIFALFILTVVLASGKKGVGSIIGMGFSLFVLLGVIAPLIIAGYNPLLVSIGGALIIMMLSIYMAHGISRQTTSAIFSTFISLVLAGVLSFLFVEIAHLTGVGSEESYSLQFGLSKIDLRGLLLGGIIIGTLGILDDITTSQSAIVFELHKTNSSLSFSSLVKKGLNVGREHVVALVNTLFLVYAGVSLGLFVVFALNPLNQPSWVLLNYQSMSEEIVRTLVGSIVLIFAVPLSTIVAAFTVKRFIKDEKRKK